MKLFHLQRLTQIQPGEAEAFVVAAPDERGARLIAAAHAGLEGDQPWFLNSFCREIASTSIFVVPTFILRDARET